MTDLSARRLAKLGLRRGAYDGANRRRFCLFEDLRNGLELRSEFDTKRERDAACLAAVERLMASRHAPAERE